LTSEESIRRAYGACSDWFDRRDGLTSEFFILDIPEESIDPLFAAVRERAEIVAVLSAGGLESFTDYQWMPDDDDELILSTFFMALLGKRRLQHFITPSKPRAPGPWVAVSRGPLDLEIAFWPDEVFGPAGAGQCPEAFRTLARYALELCEASGGSTVCLTHGCSEDPRVWLAGGRRSVYRLFP
jgi:hypothetical protein